MYKLIPVLFLLFFFPKNQAIKTTSPTWQIEPGYKITFRIANFGFMINGSLSGLKGDIHFDPANPQNGNFNVSVPVNSIKTGIALRDHDLMAEKYFNEKKYPLITFKSESMAKSGNRYFVTGGLTIKGHLQKITIPFSFSGAGMNGKFEAVFNIKRLDFGIGDNGKIMGNEITVSIAVPAIK